MQILSTVAALEALYGEPAAAATRKVTPIVTADYAAFITASPFVALATQGPEGLDCSPRGDTPGFVRIHDARTLMMPDRRGNNRVDSLRNIVTDARVGLLFLIPGCTTTLRVNGTAVLCVEPAVLDSFVMEGKPPRSVIVITVEAVIFSARGRSCGPNCGTLTGMWTRRPCRRRRDLGGADGGEVGGEAYDRAWPERARQSMW